MFVSGQWPHKAGAYLGFCSIKQLGLYLILLPRGWDANPSQGHLPA